MQKQLILIPSDAPFSLVFGELIPAWRTKFSAFASLLGRYLRDKTWPGKNNHCCLTSAEPLFHWLMEDEPHRYERFMAHPFDDENYLNFFTFTSCCHNKCCYQLKEQYTNAQPSFRNAVSLYAKTSHMCIGIGPSLNQIVDYGGLMEFLKVRDLALLVADYTLWLDDDLGRCWNNDEIPTETEPNKVFQFWSPQLIRFLHIDPDEDVAENLKHWQEMIQSYIENLFDVWVVIIETEFTNQLYSESPSDSAS